MGDFGKKFSSHTAKAETVVNVRILRLKMSQLRKLTLKMIYVIWSLKANAGLLTCHSSHDSHLSIHYQTESADYFTPRATPKPKAEVRSKDKLEWRHLPLQRRRGGRDQGQQPRGGLITRGCIFMDKKQHPTG